MRRVVLAVALTVLTSTAFARVEPADTNAKNMPQVAETPAEPQLDVALQQVIDAVKQTGFHDVGVLPMFVISAADARGKRVLFLVDPQTMQAIEVKEEPETATTTDAREHRRPIVR